jgi:putative transposase
MAYAGNQVNLSCFDLIKHLPDLKKECGWLKEINSQSLQAPIRNLDNAFTRFYKGQGNFPKYKSKRSGRQTFHIPQNVIVDGDKLIIPKFKEGIEIVLHRETKGVIKSATISRIPSGKYFVSILCDTGEDCKPKSKIKKETTVGIDLGIKDFLITSDGKVCDNPKYLHRVESKLKHTQRKYSKHKGKRTKNKLAKLHEKVANQRKDFLHKQSSKLVSENQTIAVEDLNVKGMLKNHCLAKSISDVGWSMFTTMLEYKCEWYGVNLLKIGRFEPSSRTCSNCGVVNKELTLKDREWACVKCNTEHDRDINAAVNIKNFALRNYVSGTDTKTRNELPTLVGVLTSEAHPIGSAVGG